MRRADFHLAAIQFSCRFPESPIFREATDAVVNANIDKFDRWTRYGSNLRLVVEKHPLLQLSLTSRLIGADIDSLVPADNETIALRLATIRDIALPTLNAYGYQKITSVSLAYRHLAPLSDPMAPLRDIQDTAKFLPSWALADILDMGINAAFLHNDIWYSVHVYAAFKSEMDTMFVAPTESIPERATIIAVNLQTPPSQSVVDIEWVDRLLTVPLSDISFVLNGVLDTIGSTKL